MAKVTQLETPSARARWLVCGMEHNAPDMIRRSTKRQPLVVSRYSRVFLDADDRSRCIKLIQPRSPVRDCLRKYVRCQAMREANAIRQLENLNIPTIAVHGWAVSLNPFHSAESLLLMGYFPRAVNARRYLEAQTDARVIRAFLQRISRDIAVLYRAGWHHNDCHLGNIVVQADGQYRWIDVELRRIRTARGRDRLARKSLMLLQNSMKKAVPNDIKTDFQVDTIRQLRERSA